ncbi:MAG: methylated-DNA--[protein]-cysteine S-methyltransferase [Syntrophales bacterium]|nr:methylated-DNA--[protein]-cysteine S-methyltransferase [Syntrophales bacterium]MDD4339075.1 methylated-DNA--[protein]-cysteine S-methyltransferase [Syntrophales bacterium]HOS77617.1 methylated-DNA--[protein]-cysteine S-methyltransferase [Syntrophales bacterium]
MKPAPVQSPIFVMRDTPFGPFAVVWSVRADVPGIDRILIPGPGRPVEATLRAGFPGAASGSCREIDDLAERLEASLSGADVGFPLDTLRLDLCPAFQREVLCADQAIPRGRVSTYGLVATRLGRPGAARAVGTALATNPFPLAIPCHRVIRSDGSLGGFGGGIEMKRALLAREGVEFRDAGHVAPRRFFYSDAAPG